MRKPWGKGIDTTKLAPAGNCKCKTPNPRGLALKPSILNRSDKETKAVIHSERQFFHSISQKLDSLLDLFTIKTMPKSTPNFLDTNMKKMSSN